MIFYIMQIGQNSMTIMFLSVYMIKTVFINGVSPEDFPDKVPFIKNKIRQIKSDKNIWLVYDYCYEESPEDSIWIRSIASYGHWSRILYNMLWIFAVLFLLLFSSPPLSATIY